jgi:hypothetical protein
MAPKMGTQIPKGACMQNTISFMIAVHTDKMNIQNLAKFDNIPTTNNRTMHIVQERNAKKKQRNKDKIVYRQLLDGTNVLFKKFLQPFLNFRPSSSSIC